MGSEANGKLSNDESTSVQCGVTMKTAIRCRLGLEIGCSGVHGINKEACSVKRGEAGRTYGFFDGMRLEPTEKANIVRQSSVL